MPNIKEGVYEEKIVQTIGTMGTARTQEIFNYYLARSVSEDTVRIQLMDMDDQPLPIIEQVPGEAQKHSCQDKNVSWLISPLWRRPMASFRSEVTTSPPASGR